MIGIYDLKKTTMATQNEETEVDTSSGDEQEREEDRLTDEVEEDRFRARCTDESGERVPDKEDKPPYYHEQILLADILIERIKLILDYHHGGRKLEQFKAVDFRIFTANNRNLERQTMDRLIDPRVGCIPDHILKKGDDDIFEYASARVKKYENHTSKSSDLEELENDVEKQKDTLFILVCDEGHWGATRNGAYQRMVNKWNSRDHPNVFLLLVTATPYNILTSQSRIPRHVFSYNDQGKALIEEDTGIRTRRHASMTAGQKHLNIVWWTEVIHEVIKEGLVMKLRVPVGGLQNLNRQNLPWLSVLETPPSTLSPIIATDDVQASHEFLFKGAERDVMISLVGVPDMILCVYGQALGFLSKSVAEQHPAVVCKFEVSVACGMGLIGLKASTTGQTKCYVEYDKNTRSLVMAGYSADIPPSVPNVIANREPQTLLLCDSYYLQHNSLPSKVYVPLNYYFNSMKNHDKQDQLVREDSIMNQIYTEIAPKKHGKTATQSSEDDDFHDGDLLIAEYAVFVLLMPFMQQSRISPRIADVRDLIRHLPAAWSDDYSSHVSHLLKEFSKFLPERGSKKYIPQSKFNAVLDYYKQMVKNDVGEAIRSGGDVTTALLHALFLLDTDELSELQKELLPQMQHLDQIGYHALDIDSARNRVVAMCETAHIIQDLFLCNGDSKLNGKMVVIRMSTKASQRMHATLCKARLIALKYAREQGIEYPVNFEVLNDSSKLSLSDSFNEVLEGMEDTAIYRIKRQLQPLKCEYRKPHSLKQCPCTQYKNKKSSLQCSHCNHEHRVIETYEDLCGFPCILILVNKGRMGNTFPKSFSCMDLRLCRGINPLSTVAQELGRLCRYVPEDATEPLPYCLISKEYSKFLRTNLHLNVALHSCFTQLDRHVKRHQGDGEDGVEIEARDSHADHGYKNMGDQQNRLLLSAEPQIGKTGTFLCMLSKLRQAVEGMVAEKSLKCDADGDSGSDDDSDLESVDEDEEDNDDDISPVELNHDWLYPQKDILAALKFRHEVSHSKYSRLTGPYKPGRIPRIQLKPKYEQQTQVNRAKVSLAPYRSDQDFMAYDRRHTLSCARCASLDAVPSTIMHLEHHGAKISIPQRQRFQALFEKCSFPVPGSAVGDPVDPHCDVWIFTPTCGRALIANVNLLHTMVTEDGEDVQHVHILVVRSEEFDVYWQQWGSTHAIVELPETMEDCDNDVIQGGIGYARRFIQLLAQDWNLPYIFMMDDNVVSQFEVETIGQDRFAFIVRDRAGRLRMRNVPLWHVFRHFKMLMQPPSASLGCEMGSDKFAVVGPCRTSKYISRVSIPFKRSHCSALTMLNIGLLKEKNIMYKDWGVWEDLNLNSSCEKADSWVLKVNRFQIYKKPLRTWLPKMYFWDDEDELSVAAAVGKRQPAEDELDILMRYIHIACSPSRVEELLHEDLDSTAGTDPKLRRKVQQLLQKKKAKDWHLIVCPAQRRERHEFERQLREYLEQTLCIGGYKRHSLVLTSSTCLAVGLHSRESISECLKKYFNVEDLVVCTTHKLDVYNVKYVLVNIIGTIRNASDAAAVGNVLRSANTNPRPEFHTGEITWTNDGSSSDETHGSPSHDDEEEGDEMEEEEEGQQQQHQPLNTGMQGQKRHSTSQDSLTSPKEAKMEAPSSVSAAGETEVSHLSRSPSVSASGESDSMTQSSFSPQSLSASSTSDGVMPAGEDDIDNVDSDLKSSDDGRKEHDQDSDALQPASFPPPSTRKRFTGHLMLKQMDSLLKGDHEEMRVLGTISVLCERLWEFGPALVVDKEESWRKIEEDCRTDPQAVKLTGGSKYLISDFLICRSRELDGQYTIILDDETIVKHEYTPLSAIQSLEDRRIVNVRGTITEVREIKHVKQNTFRLREVYIEEGRHEMKIALYLELADINLQVGDVLHVLRAMVKYDTYDCENQLIASQRHAQVWSEPAATWSTQVSGSP